MKPLKFMAYVLAGIVALMLVVSGAVVLYGREALWEAVAGPADMGAYDFDFPTRTGKPNDALFCPVDAPACDALAVDRRTPVFSVAADALYAGARKRVLGLNGASIVAEDAARGELRVVVRTPWLRFPDTVSLRVRPLGPDRSVVWFYSRSQIGHSDLGTNERRLRRLIRLLRQSTPYEPMPGAAAEPPEPAGSQ